MKPSQKKLYPIKIKPMKLKVDHPYEYFGRYINILGYFGFLPFNWNKNEKRLQIVKSGYKKITSKLVFQWHLVMFCCEIINAVMERRNGDVKLIERMYTYFVIAVHITTALMSIDIEQKQVEIVNVFNQLINYQFCSGNSL